jgi:signal transduction histidine kinase
MDQLLALARSQHATQIVTSQTGLDEAMTEIEALYGAIAEARNIELIVDADCGARVPGDARHLLLLIGNLLDNALRYTPAGGCVRMTTRIENSRVRIEVMDEGKGLPAAELETVFERFRRASDDDTEGSGLGLSVVRSLATQLGGRAWLENRKDRTGLCACIELPCVVALPRS